MNDLKPIGSQRICRLFVLNDNQIFVQVLGRFLDDYPDLEMVGSGIRGAAAYRHIAELQPDVIVVDPGPRVADIEPTIQSVRQASRAPIVALTQNYDEEYPAITKRAGVERFVQKMAAAEELVAAIRLVTMGAKLEGQAVDEKSSSDTSAN
jgi:DNA-binding NarL/FixJ family response regulator